MISIKKIGKQTYIFTKPINIASTACIVGPKEKEGPLHQYFDECLDDEFWGEKVGKKQKAKL